MAGGRAREDEMRLFDGRWMCAACGAVIDVPHGDEPKATLHAASGQPNVRVLTVDNREIHRCSLSEP